MFKHFLIACNLVALTGLAHAAAPTGSTRVGLTDCVTSTRSDSNLYTAELMGGTRVEISKSQEGTPTAIRIIGPDGSEATVTNVDDLLALEAEAMSTAAPDQTDVASAAPGIGRTKLARAVSNHFRTLVRTHCKRMMKEQAARLKAGTRAEPDPTSDWLLWPDLLEERAYWFGEARYQVEEAFYDGMNDWSNEIGNWIDQLQDKHKPLPACNAVREDCRSSCDRVGTYAGGVICGGLATVASALSAGVGISVGVYCGGRVLQKIEQCRFNCVMPGVPCSN